jgi:hypothetical protein
MKRLAAGLVFAVALFVGAPAQGQRRGGHGGHGGYHGGGYHGGGYHGGRYHGGGYHGGGYHGGGWHGRVYIGGPWWWGPPFPYYPYPYYPYSYYPYSYYPPYPPVVVDRGPQVYIERPLEPGYWYYCPGAKAYYPTVRECAEGWIRVPPVSR